ncbi:alpha/beta-hydrolase [Lentinus brumalis]|uniref:Alpha/beta-hydrolase n=1 Tax=Lentinus brumalis TaxID=2498619 RepID=A0A371CLD1_9APHY|nr:alpha/beta-hydrolase [Polyporus brumalis]
MGHLLRYQPFKGLYLLYVLATALVRVLWWCIRYLRPHNRPRSSWSLWQAVLVDLHREVLFPIVLDIGYREAAPQVDQELTDTQAVWIEGLADNSTAFCGEIRRAANINGVRPEKVLAFWLFKPGTGTSVDLKAKEGEKVAMHMHGGGFIMGSGHPENAAVQLSVGLVAHSKSVSRILEVDYRLSAAPPDKPVNPFPAAVLDSLAAYRYLIHDLGFDPSNITVIGDSAGGNIALALVRHLVENRLPDLPPPGRFVICSAWLDIFETRKSDPGASHNRNSKSDMLGVSVAYSRSAYLGALETDSEIEARTNRYVAPGSVPDELAKGSYVGFPRTYVSAGEAEYIYTDSVVLADRMEADGAEVRRDFPLDAIHDYMSFPWFEPERTKGIKRLANWLDE